MWPRQRTTRTAPRPQPHHASLCFSAPLPICGSARRVRTLTQNGRARPRREAEQRIVLRLAYNVAPLETARHMHMHATGREQRNRAGSLRL
jgi:hypothetical protein